MILSGGGVQGRGRTADETNNNARTLDKGVQGVREQRGDPRFFRIGTKRFRCQDSGDVCDIYCVFLFDGMANERLCLRRQNKRVLPDSVQEEEKPEAGGGEAGMGGICGI